MTQRTPVMLSLLLAMGASSVAHSSSIAVCQTKYNEERGVANYLAKVSLDREQDVKSGRLIIGAFDTSKVVWVQKTSGSIKSKGDSTVGFAVSDVSAYPLLFAVYRMSTAAYDAYNRECNSSSRACFFGENDVGVEKLTESQNVSSAAQAKLQNKC